MKAQPLPRRCVSFCQWIDVTRLFWRQERLLPSNVYFNVPYFRGIWMGKMHINSGTRKKRFTSFGSPLLSACVCSLLPLVSLHLCCQIVFAPPVSGMSCLLVQSRRGDRSGESGHHCWLPSHWWGVHLPEWGGGGRRRPGNDWTGCGQTGGPFHREQGELISV